MRLYVHRFNRRDWEEVRELTSADARLNVLEGFAGKFVDAAYFFNYERWPWPWRLSMGEVDGESVVWVLSAASSVSVYKYASAEQTVGH
jgi:RNA polymerase sigma-70 factor, ECF subfamily